MKKYSIGKLTQKICSKCKQVFFLYLFDSFPIPE